jgi:carboxypeptidase C (cathepsin A)
MSANRAWKWGSAEEGYVNVSSELQRALTANPRLHVFMGAGYYDLTTPYYPQLYTRTHLGLDKSLQQNVVFSTYLAGHQIYTSIPALKKLKEDVAAFVAASLSAPAPGGGSEKK